MNDDAEGWTASDDSAGSEVPRPDDAGPTADPDDELFAVVDSDVLDALVDVHARGLDDVLVFVDEGHGVVARNSGGENCYWVQTEIDADDFDVFRAVDVTTSLDVTALAAGLDRAGPGERVSLHYDDAAGLRLGVGRDRHPVAGDDPELSEELRERDAFSAVTGDARPEVDFRVDAGRFQAVVRAGTDHSHLRVESDVADGTVAFELVGHPDDDRGSIEFDVPDGDLVQAPADTGWGDDDHEGVADMMASTDEEFDEDTVETAVDIFEDGGEEGATSYLCTESLAPALSPMRGAVRVLHSDGRPSTRFTYSRADGVVTVKALVSHRLDEVEGLP